MVNVECFNYLFKASRGHFINSDSPIFHSNYLFPESLTKNLQHLYKFLQATYSWRY